MVRANCALSLCARRVCLRLANLSNNDTPVPDALYDVEQNGLLFFLISALANALDRGGRQVAQHSPEPSRGGLHTHGIVVDLLVLVSCARQSWKMSSIPPESSPGLRPGRHP
jgi:hypothetical protein